MIKEIVRRIGAPEYIISHGFGYVLNDVTLHASPIRLNFALSAQVSNDYPNIVIAEAIKLNLRLSGNYVVGPRTFYAEPIRLTFNLSGGAFVGEVIYLDWDAQVSTGRKVIYCTNINTQLNYKVNVEEMAMAQVRIT